MKCDSCKGKMRLVKTFGKVDVYLCDCGLKKAVGHAEAKGWKEAQAWIGEERTESTDWRQAVEDCQEVLSLIDDLPERAAEFGESVYETTIGIMNTIEIRKHVTTRQEEAIENMKTGIQNWLD